MSGPARHSGVGCAGGVLKACPKPHLPAVIDLHPVASTALPLEVAPRALALKVVALSTPPQSVLAVALQTLPWWH